MKCPECFGTNGTYQEIEDFNPGNEPEWSYYAMWHCSTCPCYLYQWDEYFKYEE